MTDSTIGSSPGARHAKTRRINLRATERQEAILRQSAESTNTTITEFVLGRVVDQAERVLADRTWFTATAMEYVEFRRLLDEPLPSTSKLDTLFPMNVARAVVGRAAERPQSSSEGPLAH